MLSLNKHIPIEFTKKSKKLQDIENQFAEYVSNNPKGGKYKLLEKGFFSKTRNKDWSFYNAPTIADIIDNAEMLFGVREVRNKIITIIKKCYFNEPIQEISEYIIKNIKE